MKIELFGGKYTYCIDEDGANQRALRHGEPWRDLVGDNFVLAMAQEIEELQQSQSEWFKVEDKVPDTYGMYDSYGNNLVVSDIVVTNVGVACYCTEHDRYDTPTWIDVDWDHKEAGRPILGITHWTPVPQLKLKASK